jgi:sugar phosphate permease
LKLVLTAFLPFALGYFLSFLFRSLNAVVAPALRNELGLDDGAIGVVTSMYLAAFTLAQLPAAWLPSCCWRPRWARSSSRSART